MFTRFAGPIELEPSPSDGLSYMIYIGIVIIIFGSMGIAFLLTSGHLLKYNIANFTDIPQGMKYRKLLLSLLWLLPVTMAGFGYGFVVNNSNDVTYLLWSPILGAVVHITVVGFMISQLKKRYVASEARRQAAEAEGRTVEPSKGS